MSSIDGRPSIIMNQFIVLPDSRIEMQVLGNFAVYLQCGFHVPSVRCWEFANFDQDEWISGVLR